MLKEDDANYGTVVLRYRSLCVLKRSRFLTVVPAIMYTSSGSGITVAVVES
jgi:hypothetical protein